MRSVRSASVIANHWKSSLVCTWIGTISCTQIQCTVRSLAALPLFLAELLHAADKPLDTMDDYKSDAMDFEDTLDERDSSMDLGHQEYLQNPLHLTASLHVGACSVDKQCTCSANRFKIIGEPRTIKE